jgi:hypothetical protein
MDFLVLAQDYKNLLDVHYLILMVNVDIVIAALLQFKACVSKQMKLESTINIYFNRNRLFQKQLTANKKLCQIARQLIKLQVHV